MGNQTRFTLGVTEQDLGDTEVMRPGDRFVSYVDIPFRVVDVATGEPIEPGPGGIVTVPRDGVYLLERVTGTTAAGP